MVRERSAVLSLLAV